MKILVLVCVASILAGCVSVGRKIDPAKVDRIQKGVTTHAQVVQLLGSPDNLTSQSAGYRTLTYHYIRATPKGESFIPIAGAFMGGANVQQQMVIVHIGPDGLVSDVITSYGATESGTGANAAPSSSLPAVEANKRPK